MQRYHATSSTNAVNNSAFGGTSTFDTARSDPSTRPANFPLNPRLGAPDFNPPTPNCPEETLTKEYVQNGYRVTVDGLEEAREISLSQLQTFTKTTVLKCKEAIKQRQRAINKSRAHKRKAGQVYGVPLTGSLLTKPGTYPEQKPCTEDFRKRWIEGLSQPHKRLRTLADQIPHGFRRKSLFEVLIRNNVPILRATWFIKVTYLNQVKPGSSSVTSGAPEKIQLSRTELLTKDVIDYLQYLLDEHSLRNNSYSLNRDRSPQLLYAGKIQHKSDPASSGIVDGTETSFHMKWRYMVRLLQWHYGEGILLPSLIIDWVLSLLQEKESLEILQLVLPIIYAIIEVVVSSQTYVRALVRVAVNFIRESSPSGSDLIDNSRRAYTTSALAELLRYFIMAVPDTFVALDCFPLPPRVVSYSVIDGSVLSKGSEDVGKSKGGLVEVSHVFREKGSDILRQPALNDVVLSIKKRTDFLMEAVSPCYRLHSVANSVQSLDKALVLGDVKGAYKFLFEDLCGGAYDESWIAAVSPCLKSSLKLISTVSLSLLCSVFILCEWASCVFRDYRTSPPNDLKFTGRRDFSQVYIALRLIKMKMEEMKCPPRVKSNRNSKVNSLAKDVTQCDNDPIKISVGNVGEIEENPKSVKGGSVDISNIFQSPGVLHEIIVCWIDQHDVHKGELQHVQLLIMELIRSGIFYPQAYVRQLIVSGYIDTHRPFVDLGRRMRHHRILKHLPASCVHNMLEEAHVTEASLLLETMQIYSNERRLVLRELVSSEIANSSPENITSQKKKQNRISTRGGSTPSPNVWKSLQSFTSSSSLVSKNVKMNNRIAELKASISVLLHFPNSSSTPSDSGIDESQSPVISSVGLVLSKIDHADVTPGCKDCIKVKRQKVSDEMNSYVQGHSSKFSDDEDLWWVKKGTKSFESIKVEVSPLKQQVKQASRVRQKIVRKTQSLAQLAAARIEGSQGGSTSHVCDNKITCPRHRTGMEGEPSKLVDNARKSHIRDIVSVVKALKELSFLEKRTVSMWLITKVQQCVEDNEKTSKVGQLSRPLPANERGNIQWKLGEDELSVILYLMDVCNNLVPAITFLFWLLPKAPSSGTSTIHGGRTMSMMPRNVEINACEVGEVFILSSIQRYENIIAATNLIPEALSAAMQYASKVLSTNGRISSSPSLVFSRYLLRKYSSLSSVVDWEKNFKATCDKRLFSELESARSLNVEVGFPLGIPPGVEDIDDFIRQKVTSGRISRVGMNMRDIVEKHLNEAFRLGKDKKQFPPSIPNGAPVEKSDDGFHVAQQIINGLMDCIRQTGGAAQEGDPALVSSAVSAIVCNVGPAMAKLADFTAGSTLTGSSSTTGQPMTHRILRVMLRCLSLLKDALGERQSRTFEIALAAEASSAIAGVFAPGKNPRNQFQLSPESHDSNSNMFNEVVNNPSKAVVTRATKIVAAVSALIVGAVIHGVTSLERLVTVLRLKEGLDLVQIIRSTKSNSNGNSRTVGILKMETSIEVCVHWFRLLVGSCMTLCDGLIVELLGKSSVVALSRMQRALPVSLVFPPAYSMFALVIWRPYLFTHNIAGQLHQSISLAVGDAIKHLPFREACLRDTHDFYDLVVADAGDAEFAALLELNTLDSKSRTNIIFPLRARLFLNALIDCRMPPPAFIHDERNQVSSLEKERKHLDTIVRVLDSLQPAKLHWQWVELRLLLNEQALHEKIANTDMPLSDAIRFLSSNSQKATAAASENENNFIEIILTRILVRPDAAPLFAEVVHLFGKSLKDSMLMQTKWFLGGNDVLLGLKSIRQRLINIAESKRLSTKPEFCKPWGWSNFSTESVLRKGAKRKSEASFLEEGEVVEEGTDSRKNENVSVSQQHVTERALVELVLPCIDQSSDESRNTFASDLIKQMNNIEQQINAVTRGTSIKQGATITSAIEGPTGKGSNRRGIKVGSPGIGKRATAVVVEPAPPSPAALRASISLRLQFILRLLPAICADGEPSARIMRQMLASVIIRLLGSRVVHEDACLSFYTMNCSPSKRHGEPLMEASSASGDLSGESLFDKLILVLHGLLSNSRPSWLKTKRISKSTNELIKDFSGIDREAAEALQNELHRMQVPDAIRWRIQAAMPMVLPSVRRSVSCQPPSLPPNSLPSLQPGTTHGNLHTTPRNLVSPVRNPPNFSGKHKSSPIPLHDHDIEIDPWTLLEDGAGASSSNPSVISSNDPANLKAASWLKGAVRVRRTDLTYIGSVDDDS